MKIAIGFDGTCVTHEYPKVGKDIGAVPVLKKFVAHGHLLTLNTMRSGKELQEAVDWFALNDIPLYGVNEDPGQKNWTQSPKVFAHLYIDDASLGAPLKHNANLSERPFIDWDLVGDIMGEVRECEDIMAASLERKCEFLINMEEQEKLEKFESVRALQKYHLAKAKAAWSGIDGLNGDDLVALEHQVACMANTMAESERFIKDALKECSWELLNEKLRKHGVKTREEMLSELRDLKSRDISGAVAKKAETDPDFCLKLMLLENQCRKVQDLYEHAGYLAEIKKPQEIAGVVSSKIDES